MPRTPVRKLRDKRRAEEKEKRLKERKALSEHQRRITAYMGLPPQVLKILGEKVARAPGQPGPDEEVDP